jgi:hypothetical protein
MKPEEFIVEYPWLCPSNISHSVRIVYSNTSKIMAYKMHVYVTISHQYPKGTGKEWNLK